MRPATDPPIKQVDDSAAETYRRYIRGDNAAEYQRVFREDSERAAKKLDEEIERFAQQPAG